MHDKEEQQIEQRYGIYYSEDDVLLRSSLSWSRRGNPERFEKNDTDALFAYKRTDIRRHIRILTKYCTDINKEDLEIVTVNVYYSRTDKSPVFIGPKKEEKDE